MTGKSNHLRPIDLIQCCVVGCTAKLLVRFQTTPTYLYVCEVTIYSNKHKKQQ